MTYNVHSCVGLDGQLSVERISRVIHHSKPDVVALQELDAGRMKRGRGVNQARMIAERLRMEFHFHSIYGSASEAFGNAILSVFPLKWRQAESLPRSRYHASMLEMRGALWVEIACPKRTLHVINTHLSLWGSERVSQIACLMDRRWLLNPDLREELVLLCGDFNMTPYSSLYRTLSRNYRDVISALPWQRWRNVNTWTSRWPIRRLDYIFVKGDAPVSFAGVPRDHADIHASDHLPVIADLSL